MHGTVRAVQLLSRISTAPTSALASVTASCSNISDTNLVDVRDDCVVLAAIATVTASNSPGWYAVVGALAGASIVATVSYVVWRQQREADSTRLDKQLGHDRTMREAASRAAADRLDQQLAHDRELRDLEHARAELAPIVEHAIKSIEPVEEIFHAVEHARNAPELSKRQQSLRPHMVALRHAGWALQRHRLGLAIVVGIEAPVVQHLDALAYSLKQAADAVRDWLDGSLSQDEAMVAIVAARDQHARAGGGFLHTAFQTAGWREVPGLDPLDIRSSRDTQDRPC